jgi:hypothetical protein
MGHNSLSFAKLSTAETHPYRNHLLLAREFCALRLSQNEEFAERIAESLLGHPFLLAVKFACVIEHKGLRQSISRQLARAEAFVFPSPPLG